MYTVQQKIEIIKIHYKNGEDFAVTKRIVNTSFGRYKSPCRSTIVNLIKKFESTGSVADITRENVARPIRSTENIAIVAESVAKNARLSLRKRSQHLGMSYGSLHRILHDDLGMKAYKVQLVQELKPEDHSHRRNFVDWIQQMNENDHDFVYEKIIMSDEAHFHLSGYVNKQNSRIWGSENPKATISVPIHSERVTVWCGFWGKGVIGSYFFENEAGKTVTVNGERYRSMLTNFLWSQIKNLNLNDVYFQQDGATCHTSHETIEMLQQKFPGRVISRFGDINYPPRSCDLTPLDFFLWGFVKDKVYYNAPETTATLKNNIREVIGEIKPELCKIVMGNFIKRISLCSKLRGGHLPDIVFHL